MIKNLIRKALRRVIGFLLPQPAEIERIENMSPSDFCDFASRPVESPPDGIHSLFKYKDPLVRKALWLLKYRGNRRIARLFALLICDALVEVVSDESLYADFSKPIIIPIPLSRERRRERGWNQAEMIARELGKIQPEFSVQTGILEKKRHTSPQTRLSRSSRMKNLKGCFSIENPALVKNRNVILIDDVVTTGSTIEEARRTLSRAGAKRIIAFTIAH